MVIIIIFTNKLIILKIFLKSQGLIKVSHIKRLGLKESLPFKLF